MSDSLPAPVSIRSKWAVISPDPILHGGHCPHDSTDKKRDKR